ncbi:GNAT family N-acetyltransferase [Halobacteriales archaeon QS_1_68_20]|nr:MAG: GNAT family N-acetyltransferase [Halobacteriales archaeon QS_1_68_20]
MTLRTATPDDAPAVQRVARASWHAAHDQVLGADAVDDLIDQWYDVAGLRESIERDDRPMFVAVADGDLVGFASGGPTEGGPADAVVSRIYVHPDRWGEGHGTALLERLFEALREADSESVWLAVLADNEVGRSFYEARGFAVHEERTVELADQEVEDVVMVRSLDE